MQTKQLTQKEILAKFLVTTKYTLKVLGGFVISGIVSVFGLYPLVASFFKSETALYITLVGFIGLLILIDSIKRSTLSRYYNSKLKSIILGSKTRTGYLNISIMSILFVMLIDGSGAWLTGVTGAKYYTENKAVQTEEYRNIGVGKENDSLMFDAYKSDLKSYEQREADYRSLCKANLASGKWKDSVTKNMSSWYKNNYRPIPPKLASSGDINLEFKNIKEDNKSFLDEYLQYVIFVVLMLLTGLLQYLTISEIKEDYEDLEDSLTPNRISNLKTALATAQDIEEQHEKKQFKDKEVLQKKKNEQIRDMDILDDKREIVFNAKAIVNGNDGLMLIANNNDAYVPTDESKAGFVVTPFGEDKENNQTVSTTETPIKKEEKHINSNRAYIIDELGKVSQGGKVQLSKEFIKENKDYLDEFVTKGSMVKVSNSYWSNTDYIYKGNPKTIMMRLFKNTTVKKGEKLTPKTKVINIKERRHVEAIGKIYKKLLELKIIERKGSNGGYYSLKALSEKDINILEDKHFNSEHGFIYNKQPYRG